MRGLENHGVLLGLGASFVAEGSVSGRLYHCRYPAFVPCADGGLRVQGELYGFRAIRAALSVLDAFEDEGAMYARIVVPVRRRDGSRAPEAYAYRYLLPTEGCRLVPSGDFRRHTDAHALYTTRRSQSPNRSAASRH
ncbi:MAG: gamma-glutamylcyclotransferase [Candidatus Eremiobacteraeota bacterium]|nr:gamma-glutamylcyclotransferase [Candidatus Eremiobacteraeota bacterium]